MLSSVDATNLELRQDITDCVKNKKHLVTIQPVEPDQLGERKVEFVDSLLCLEFKVLQDPQLKLASLRKINKTLLETHFRFQLKGMIHSQEISDHPSFEFNVHGSEIIKSITDRLIQIRSEMTKVGIGLKDTEQISFIAAINTESGVRFAVEAHFPMIMHLRSSQTGV